MKTQQQDSKSKDGKDSSTGKGDDKAQLKSRHSQTGQQQAQQGGATQGPGKGKSSGK